jgi:hypothetical protein
MSGTFPTSPGPATIDLDSNQPTIVDIAESGKRQSRIVAGHLWRIKLAWPKMTRADFAPIFAFAASQRGRLGSFQITLPHLSAPQGVGTGTPLVDGAHTAGDSTINIDGWTASQIGIMKAGDILLFASHSKVYMATADADSAAGGGLATIPIEPPLIENLANNEAVTIINVPFTVAFEDDIQKWKTSAPQLAAYTANLIESI